MVCYNFKTGIFEKIAELLAAKMSCMEFVITLILNRCNQMLCITFFKNSRKYFKLVFRLKLKHRNFTHF